MSLAQWLLGSSERTITAGYNFENEVSGYSSPAVAPFYGASAMGSISGAQTPFGLVEHMVGEFAELALSSPVGMPTTLTIAGVAYPLTFIADSSGYRVFDFEPGFTMIPFVTYSWSLS